MACFDCTSARVTTGHWRMFNPACLYCGARLIQQIAKVGNTNAEITQRRRAVLKDWMAWGHAEQELRDLAKGLMAVEPVTKGAPDAQSGPR